MFHTRRQSSSVVPEDLLEPRLFHIHPEVGPYANNQVEMQRAAFRALSQLLEEPTCVNPQSHLLEDSPEDMLRFESVQYSLHHSVLR